MSTYLRKMVVLGAGGVVRPGSDQDYTTPSNPAFFTDTSTGWMRVWAPWYLLQRNQNLAPDDPAQPGAASWWALNQQVDAARNAGLRVIVTAYGYAYWSNGSQQFYDGNGTLISTAPNPQQEREDGAADRYAKSDWDAYVTAGRTDAAAAANLKTNKTHYLKFPSDLTPTGPWAKWIDFLIQTFTGRAWGIEICNEPGNENWPLMGPSTNSANDFDTGPLTVQNVIADMFKSAHEKNAARGYPLRLFGPSTLDRLLSASTRRVIDYRTFTDQLLTALSARGFLGDQAFAWSHHNYADILYDLGPAVNGTHLYTGTAEDYPTLRAAQIRNKLVAANWRGYTDANASPTGVWITEGGADLQKVSNLYYGTVTDRSFNTNAYQRAALLIQRAWARANNDNSSSQNGGFGIALFSNYLWYTSDYPNDTGLREPVYDGGPRPSYTAWKGLAGSL